MNTYDIEINYPNRLKMYAFNQTEDQLKELDSEDVEIIKIIKYNNPID